MGERHVLLSVSEAAALDDLCRQRGAIVRPCGTEPGKCWVIIEPDELELPAQDLIGEHRGTGYVEGTNQ